MSMRALNAARDPHSLGVLHVLIGQRIDGGLVEFAFLGGREKDRIDFDRQRAVRVRFHKRRRGREKLVPLFLGRVQLRRFRQGLRVQLLNRLHLRRNHGDQERVERPELSAAPGETVVEFHDNVRLLRLLNRRLPGRHAWTVRSRIRCTMAGVAWASFNVGLDKAAPNCGTLTCSRESLLAFVMSTRAAGTSVPVNR